MNLGPSSSSGGAEKDKDSLWYFTAEQLANSPSRKYGIDCDLELSYRQMTAYLIQEMGQRLQVSQLCINTAIVYMHRFYAFHSFTHFHRNGIAAASLFLAAKVEEQPRKLEHVIKAANKCLQQPPSSTSDAFYVEQAQDLVFNENVLLQTLGFDVAIDHPHTHVVKTCQLVKACKDLAQTSYFLASNSLHLTSMCLQYKPTVVACFCIYLACKWSRWEIPQSTEGRHWFYYVDKTVTMDLLKQLTDEFIAIYEKSPARLKSKLNSIKALAQGASNRVISKEKRSSQEDWKMGDMMKMYHSSINTNEPNSNSGHSGPYGSQQQPVDPNSQNVLSSLLPPPPLQTIRKPDMHASQSRSHHSSSTHHAKMAFPSGDIPGDHKSNHKQQGFSGGPLQRSREHAQGHQSMVPITNLQRTNVGGSSGRPSSAGNLSVQSNQRSSTQSHPTDASGYQKVRDRSSNSSSMSNNAALHMSHKLGQKQHDGSRNVSKDAMGKLNEQSKHTSKQMYPNPQLNVPHFGNNQLQSIPPSGSKLDPTHDLRMSGHRNYVGGNIRPSAMPPNYHQAQLDRANQNSKLEQQKMSYHHSHKQIPSIEQTFVPGNQDNTTNTQQHSHQLHNVSSDYVNMRPPENVPSEDHTNLLFSGSYNMAQQQQQHAKQNSMFSPEWNDKMQHQQQQPQNLLIGNESLAKLNVDPYAFKSSSSIKDSPKKNERDRLIPESSIKKEKTKNNMHLTSDNNNPLILSRSNNSQSQQHQHQQQQHKFNAIKPKLETSPQLLSDHNTSASLIAPPGLKRPIEPLSKYEEASLLQNNKLRKVEIMPPVPPFNDVKPIPDINKHQVINGIETNPDMVKSLLKETLCVPSLLLNETSNTVNEAMDIDNSTNVSIEPPVPEQSGDKQQSSGSKSEKKKKKDKHKHKEKDKDKSKDREERKKHKKDKEKHKEKEREVVNPAAHVKIKITKEKLEAASGSNEQPIFKIKIPKDRITGDINIGGGSIGSAGTSSGTGASVSGGAGGGNSSSSSTHSHSVMHTASSTMPYTPALKIKISKDKLENYNSGAANQTIGSIEHSSIPTTSTYTTQQLPSTSTGHSSSSGSSKKKDRDRDRERDKEKKRSSHDFSRSNGGTNNSSTSSKSHHQNK